MKKRILFSVLLIGVMVIGYSFAASQKPSPRGIYVLVSSRKIANPSLQMDRIISKPFVDGVLIAAAWKEIQPSSESTFDWEPVDRYLRLIKAKGKRASLVVFTGRSCTPEWVYAKGVRKWTYVNHKGETVTQPNPMDTLFYDLWVDFVKAFGARYGNDASIVQVSMCGATGTLCGLRFPFGLPVGWNREFVIKQWKRIVDTYVAAFPEPFLTFEVHTTKGEGLALCEEMMEYNYRAYGTKIGPFEEFLSASAPQGPLAEIMIKWGPKSNKTWCGFQQARPLGNDLDAGYTRGYNDCGCKYFEIYKTDLNPASDSVNQKWHDAIWKE